MTESRELRAYSELLTRLKNAHSGAVSAAKRTDDKILKGECLGLQDALTIAKEVYLEALAHD